MTECVLLGFAGDILGFAVGAAIAFVISTVGIPMPPPPNSNIGYIAAIDISPGLAIEAMGIGAIATILAAMIPAFRARSVTIVDALRAAN
jgi:putative ABC transport system permease protein